MLKVYLSSVAVWFLIAMAEGLLFREQFRKSRDMVREHLKTKDKIDGIFKTIMNYLLISFVPIIRCIFLITKMYMTACPEKYIKLLEEKLKDE